MLARVSLSARISLDEFKQKFGSYYESESDLKKAYEIAVKNFPAEEKVKEEKKK